MLVAEGGGGAADVVTTRRRHKGVRGGCSRKRSSDIQTVAVNKKLLAPSDDELHIISTRLSDVGVVTVV